LFHRADGSADGRRRSGQGGGRGVLSWRFPGHRQDRQSAQDYFPVKARLYFGHAVEDPTATPEQVKVLEDALREWHGAFESEFYEGAQHGWTVPGRDVYDEAQADRAFEKMVELFEATLQ
jgi:dienelactone hydrolase